MANATIRDCTTDDYPAIVEIHNAIYTDRPTVVSSLTDGDKRRDPKCKHHRWVAEQDGRVVGFAVYGQSIWEYHPQKFHVGVNVLPEYQKQGIGSALYNTLMAGLQPFNPNKLRADAYENMPDGLRFLEKRGFKEDFRESKSELDVTTFDPSPYTELEEKLIAEGIEFTTKHELENDPNLHRALYDLEHELFLDIPGVKEEEVSWPSFEDWFKETEKETDALPEMYLIARHNGKYIGLSIMSKDRASDAIYQWLTGVTRTYRRRGIALALKLRGIAYAKANGCPVIKTSNPVQNEPMLALNHRLGFEPLPDWLQMEKIIEEETTS